MSTEGVGWFSEGSAATNVGRGDVAWSAFGGTDSG
jgi:hypothetical protein